MSTANPDSASSEGGASRLSILLVEDCENDALLLLRVLERQGFQLTWQRVESSEEMLRALQTHEWDVILSDYRLPQFSAPAALRLLQESGLDIPFVVVSGTVGEDVAVDTMRAGAHDYLLKGNLARIGEAIRRELREAQIRREHRRHAKQIEHLNKILRAIRNVNQLIVHEKNSKRLIEKACALLVETRGYDSAWIVLSEDLEHPKTNTVSASGRASELIEHLGTCRQWPECCLDALAASEGMAVHCPKDDCPHCPVGDCAGDGVLAVGTLRHAGREYGFLGVALPREFAFDRDLFLEVVGDIAFALYGIETERQRERYARIVAFSQEPMALVGRGYIFLEVNPSYAQLIGRTENDCVGRSVVEVVGEEFFYQTIKPHLDRCFAGEHVHFRARRLFHTGVLMSLDTYYAPCREPNGETSAVAVCARDMTDLQRALEEREAAAAETNALLQATRAVIEEASFERAAAIVVEACRTVTKADLGYLSVVSSSGADEELLITGHQAESEWTDIASRLVNSNRRAEACRSGNVVADNNCSLPCKGGVLVQNVLHAPLKLGGAIAGVMGLANKPVGFADGDARLAQAFAELAAIGLRNARQSESLRQSEERYRTLVENLDDVVFSLDDQGRVTYVSSGITRYGYDSSEVVGLRFATFVHPEDLPGLVASYQRTLTGTTEPYEFRVQDKSGRTHFVRSSSRPIQSQGRNVGLTGVLVDLTAQREAEDRLRVAQRMEAIGRLAGGIAHDFNNVLSVILNCAEFAREGIGEGNPARDDLEQIGKAATRAAALTRQLLAFSRKQILQPEVLSLNSVVGELRKMLERLIGEDILFEFRPAPDLWQTKADRGQLEQVVVNLAVNARDAMPSGGTLLVETCNEQLAEGSVQLRDGASAGPYVVLTITDTGCGMDKNTQSRLFEPFFTTKSMGKGTGLGLATVYGIVKQSGGMIWVQSEIGRGSTFKVYLPSAQDTETSQTVTRAEDRPVTGSETVLVVEDEDAVRNMARRILAAAGYKVLTARNGDEALRLCESNAAPIDILLTDMVMPGMGGRELAKRLETMRPGLRVLFASGYTDDAVLHLGGFEPGTNFLEKPFTREELTRRIRGVLDGVVVGPLPRPDTLVTALLGQEQESEPLKPSELFLPQAVRIELRKAAAAARYDVLLGILQRAQNVSPQLAQKLIRQASNFDWEGVLDSLESASTEDSDGE